MRNDHFGSYALLTAYLCLFCRLSNVNLLRWNKLNLGFTYLDYVLWFVLVCVPFRWTI